MYIFRREDMVIISRPAGADILFSFVDLRELFSERPVESVEVDGFDLKELVVCGAALAAPAIAAAIVDRVVPEDLLCVGRSTSFMGVKRLTPRRRSSGVVLKYEKFMVIVSCVWQRSWSCPRYIPLTVVIRIGVAVRKRSGPERE